MRFLQDQVNAIRGHAARYRDRVFSYGSVPEESRRYARDVSAPYEQRYKFAAATFAYASSLFEELQVDPKVIEQKD